MSEPPSYIERARLTDIFANLRDELSNLGILASNHVIGEQMKKLEELANGIVQKRNLFSRHINADILTILLNFLNQYERALFRRVNKRLCNAISLERVEEYRLYTRLDAPWHAIGQRRDDHQLLRVFKINCKKCDYACVCCGDKLNKPKEEIKPQVNTNNSKNSENNENNENSENTNTNLNTNTVTIKKDKRSELKRRKKRKKKIKQKKTEDIDVNESSLSKSKNNEKTKDKDKEFERHSIGLINGNYKLYSIEANIRWVDQRWGNRKGSIYLKLFDKNGDPKASLKLFQTCKHETSEMKCKYTRNKTFEINKEEDSDSNSNIEHPKNKKKSNYGISNKDDPGLSHKIFDHEEGDYYQFWRYVGGGGGHTLTIYGFQAKLTFD